VQFAPDMLKINLILFFFLLCVLPPGVNGQETGMDVDPILIRLKAQLISKGDSMAVPYANVVYTRNRTGTVSNSGGFFSIEMLNVDSLIISAMGFKTLSLKVPRNYSESTTLVIYMQPVFYPIIEVQVAGNKNKVDMNGIPAGKQSDIPTDLRGDAFNKKPPVLAAFFNPLSYWQYYLSHREKEKRLVRQAVALEKNWEMHSQNYNKEKVMLLTGLDENEAENFMIWFNSKNVLPYTSTEYEVRASIRSWFEVYKKEKGLN
jgi:hypothetical protein